MGKRAQAAKPIEARVRIFGTKDEGRVFSSNVITVDIRRSPLKLSGGQTLVKVDEIIGLTHGRNKVHFRVKWKGTWYSVRGHSSAG